MRISGEDSEGVTHWLVEDGRGGFHWGDLTHASDMPLIVAERHIKEILQRNRYIEPDWRIRPTLVKDR